jgi:hypothetical protein
MKLFIGLLLIVSGLIALRGTTHEHRHDAAIVPKEITAATDLKTVPVIVELFTSEGCSSCPPADDLLARLDRTQPVQGAEIIALGEHVDYWNRLGWVDPFSSAGFSARQSQYADAFARNSVYTPQMVVDGRDEFSGGNANKALEAIARAAQSPKADIQIVSLEDSAATKDVKLSIHVRDLPRTGSVEPADVVLAITENNLRSDVTNGENSGRHLAHTAVVRRLTVLGRIDAGKDSFDVQSALDLARGWKRENLRAVVFVQEQTSRHVLGAAVSGLLVK